MKPSGRHKKALEQILHSQDFDQLLTFSDEKTWDEMGGNERQLLARLFVMQGEKQLVAGDEKVLESFKIANRAAPDNPQILYEQALVLQKQTHNVSCLKAAAHIFSKTLVISPEFFEAWHESGNTWVLLGLHSHEEDDFLKALAHFQEAEKFVNEINPEKKGIYYHDYALAWYHLGRHSEEASDFHQALKMYQSAYETGFGTHRFWNDYGNCFTELSLLLVKPSYIVEAIEKYWNGVKLKPDYYEGWMNFSISLQVLYEIHSQETYFLLAEQGFSQASRLNSDNFLLWLKWGQLHALRGKILKDVGNLFESCKKFEKANQSQKDCAAVLSSWAESLLLMAEETDDLSFLKQAAVYGKKSWEIQPENPLYWGLYARCLMALGCYFDEKEYYEQAHVLFKNALECFPKDHSLWHGASMVAQSLSYYVNEKEFLQEGIDCCRKAIETGGHAIAHYWNDWGVSFMRFGLLTEDKDSIEAALNRFEQALRLKSAQSKGGGFEPEWTYNYGCALDYFGEHEKDASYFEKAIDVFKKVIDFDPTFDYVYFNLALTYAHHGELTSDLESYSFSFKYLGVYLALQPEDGGAWQEWGLFLMDLAHLIQDPSNPDDYKKCLFEAEEKLIRARLLGEKGAVYHLACVQALLGNVKISLHFLERAKELNELPTIEEITHDPWLEKVKETLEFKSFIDNL